MWDEVDVAGKRVGARRDKRVERPRKYRPQVRRDGKSATTCQSRTQQAHRVFKQTSNPAASGVGAKTTWGRGYAWPPSFRTVPQTKCKKGSKTLPDREPQ